MFQSTAASPVPRDLFGAEYWSAAEIEALAGDAARALSERSNKTRQYYDAVYWATIYAQNKVDTEGIIFLADALVSSPEIRDQRRAYFWINRLAKQGGKAAEQSRRLSEQLKNNDPYKKAAPPPCAPVGEAAWPCNR